MTLNFIPRAVALLSLCVAVSACQDGGAGSGAEASRKGFKSNYNVARSALEKGQFAKASRHYADLLPRSGPFKPRVRLEYAHALLREGKFDLAAAEARKVASQLDGAARSAALAVQGTADQEWARARLTRGQTGTDVATRLRAARTAFDEVLQKNPELDPLGALEVRRKSVELELASLG